MSNLNIAAKTATNTTASGASITATASANANRAYQILGFDGSSNDQAVTVELKFGSTVIATMHGGTNTPTGRHFGEIGPVASTNTEVTVVTTPAASGQCDANLYYREMV